MTDHGWPDFHDDGGHHEYQHDDFGHDPDLGHDEPLVDSHEFVHDEHLHDEPLPEEPVHADAVIEHPLEHTVVEDVTDPADDITPHTVIGADLDAVTTDDTPDVFPPTLDVGDLPEPVDGFPWIDTGSLGVIDAATLDTTHVDPVDPHELAEYAGVDLPPGADPWATLAESEDPATAALARWWTENQ
jgi:hypothetical protein